MYVTKKRKNKKVSFFYVTFIMIKRKSFFIIMKVMKENLVPFSFRLFVFEGFSCKWELKKQKKKKKKKTHSCIRREIILVGLYWEQSSTALKQRIQLFYLKFILVES